MAADTSISLARRQQGEQAVTWIDIVSLYTILEVGIVPVVSLIGLWATSL